MGRKVVWTRIPLMHTDIEMESVFIRIPRILLRREVCRTMI